MKSIFEQEFINWDSKPGTESVYKKLGFKRMSTAMAIFQNQDQAMRVGLINEA